MLTAPLRAPGATCPDCRTELLSLPKIGRCWDCEEKRLIAETIRIQSEQILGDIDNEIRKRLTAMGMGAKEMRATRDEISPPIRAVFRGPLVRQVEALASGRIPTEGFGLTGPTGVGKSLALAALIRAYVERLIRRQAPIEGRAPMDVGVVWCSWPAEAEWLREHGTEARATAARLRDLQEAPLLILDDLGAAGIKGDYLEDYPTRKLDVVIDARSREERPTIWTSNMTELGIGQTFGSRISSRLLGECPPVSVSGPDRRLA